jgi:hypothetical protein
MPEGMSLDPDNILEMTQWDYFWVPDDVTVVDRPELLFYSCARDVPVLNTVTRTRGDAERLPALVDEVTQAHGGVRSRWLVRNLPGAAPLERTLAGAHYVPSVHTVAAAIDVSEHAGRTAGDILVRRVHDMPSLRDCVAVADRAFPGTRSFTEEELERDLGICAAAESRVQRYVAYDSGSGQPLSSGGLTLFPKLKFGLLWGGGTIPEARGRGAYTGVLKARVDAAREHGLTHVGLYAVTTTSAPIILRQGFKTYGTMTYWERPARTG